MNSKSGHWHSRLLEPFERLVDGVADPKRGDATAFALIAVYVLVWWAYAVIAKGSQDIHFDMGEVAIWGLVPAFGYPKHPPFPGWVATAWFAIFPRADWSFYLLSATSIGIALWFVWLIATRFVVGDKRALALAMLALSPDFNFQPLKFNSNALLIPVWAAASYAFLRSFQDRTLAWGILAGVAAALAMLTKYWSIFLIIGFLVAVFSDRRCWGYLRSPAPWALIMAGALVFAPNVVSLFQYDFQPFKYATSAHAVAQFDDLFRSTGHYLGGLLYLAGGLAAVGIACRPSLGSVRDTMFPHERDRRLMVVAISTAFLAPILLSFALETRLDSLWTMPMWSMLPAALLGSSKVAVTRRAAAGVLAAACAVSMVSLLLSPAIAYAIHQRGVPNYASHYRLIAGAVDEAWRRTSERPLRFLGGHGNIALSASFYLPSRPLFFDIAQPNLSPWADDAQMARDGFAMVCPAIDGGCLDQIQARAVGSATRRTEVNLSRTYFGVPDPPVRYVIVTVPPRS